LCQSIKNATLFSLPLGKKQNIKTHIKKIARVLMAIVTFKKIELIRMAFPNSDFLNNCIILKIDKILKLENTDKAKTNQNVSANAILR
jgi:predicted nucleotide-binding protein